MLAAASSPTLLQSSRRKANTIITIIILSSIKTLRINNANFRAVDNELNSFVVRWHNEVDWILLNWQGTRPKAPSKRRLVGPPLGLPARPISKLSLCYLCGQLENYIVLAPFASGLQLVPCAAAALAV